MIGLKRDGDNLSTPKKKKWKLFLIILGIVMIVAVIFIVFIVPNFNNSVIALPTCGDGSFYNSCSLEKPYYCNGSGTLVENSSMCGCQNPLSKNNNSCVSDYQSFPRTVNFSYVLDGNNKSITFTFYKGFVAYLSTIPNSIVYTNGQQPLRSDFTLMRLNEPTQEALLTPLVKEIENLASHSGVDQVRIAVSLVQNIPWGSSGETLAFGGIKLIIQDIHIKFFMIIKACVVKNLNFLHLFLEIWVMVLHYFITL